MLKTNGVEHTAEKLSVASPKTIMPEPDSCNGSARSSKSARWVRENFEVEGEFRSVDEEDNSTLKPETINNEETDDSSPSELKQRLRDLPAQIESSLVVDRSGALNRILRRKRDSFFPKQDGINSIIEQDEVEVLTDSSNGPKLNDARARRRAMLYLDTVDSVTRSGSSKRLNNFEIPINDPLSDECKSTPGGQMRNRRDNHHRDVFSDGSYRSFQRRKQMYRHSSDDCSSSPDGKITRQVKSLLPPTEDKCWTFFEKLEKYRTTSNEKPTGISIKNLTSESDNDTGNEQTSGRSACYRHPSSEPLKFFGYGPCDVDVVSIDLSSSPERVSEESNSRRHHSDRTVASSIANGFMHKCHSDRPLDTISSSPSVRNSTRSESYVATKLRMGESNCTNDFFARRNEEKLFYASKSRSPDSGTMEDGCFRVPLLDIRSDELSRSFSSGSKDGKFETHVVSPASFKLDTKENDVYRSDEFATEGFKNRYDDASSRGHTRTLNTPTFPNLKECNTSIDSPFSLPKSFFAEEFAKNNQQSPYAAESSLNDTETNRSLEANSDNSQTELSKKSNFPTPTESTHSRQFDIDTKHSICSSDNMPNTAPSTLRSGKKYLDPIIIVPVSTKDNRDSALETGKKTEKCSQRSNSRVLDISSCDYLLNDRSMAADNLSETDNEFNLDDQNKSSPDEYGISKKFELYKSNTEDTLISQESHCKSISSNVYKGDIDTITKTERIKTNFECGDEINNNNVKIPETITTNLLRETGGSMPDGCWSNSCANPTKVLRCEGAVLFCNNDATYPLIPSKSTASTSKLTSLLEGMKKETQDRSPFTISESTSRKSIKNRIASDDDIARQVMSTSEDSLDKKSHLKIHSHFEQISLQSYNSSPVTQWISSSCQTERENIVPRMKKFIRKFSARIKVSDKNKPSDSESMKIIYENGEFLPECSSPIEVYPSKFKFSENERFDDSEISSGKTVKSKKNDQDISISPSKRGDLQLDCLWLQDVEDEDFTKNENTLNSEKENIPLSDLDTDRFSVFLAKRSISENALSGPNREKSDISSSNLTKRAFESDDEIDKVKSGCGFCFCRQDRSLKKRRNSHNSSIMKKTLRFI